MDFKERLNKVTQRNLKVKHRKNQVWPLEKRIEVVSQYLVLGNMKLVAAVTGVSHDLVRQWKGMPWWPELEAEIRATQNIEVDTKLSKIVDKSLDAVLDRVENGEMHYDRKTGRIIRTPASLKDIHRVSVDTLTKRELLRGNATERKETTQVSVKEQLELLAQEFAKWTNKPKQETIDVEMVEVIDDEEIEDAIYEERETRLQTRIGLGAQEEAGEGEGESGEEFSSLGSDGQGTGEKG